MSTGNLPFGKPSMVSGKSRRLVHIDPADKAYYEVERLFLKGWKHKEKNKPVIRALYEVACTQPSLDSYTEYKFQIQVVNQLSNYRKCANEQLLFHGTSQACSFGENLDDVSLCYLPNCSLCSIIRNSFDIQRCGSRHHFRRFGHGIYVTSCSSKADDYFSSKNNTPNSRVLLVNRVIVGKASKQRYNATNLTEAPRGYNSVVGLPGGDLRYPETVLYHNDAIRPAYVIVYGQGSSSKEPGTTPKLAFWTSLFSTPLAT